MKSIPHSHYLVYLVLSLLLGCTAGDAAVEPVWGKQPCDHCHMLLSEPRSAAQLVTRDGERQYFDDVGCMVERLARDARSVARVWVRDAQGVWVDARQARYSAGASTPMGYGVLVSAHGDLDFAQVQRELGRSDAAQEAP